MNENAENRVYNFKVYIDDKDDESSFITVDVKIDSNKFPEELRYLKDLEKGLIEYNPALTDLCRLALFSIDRQKDIADNTFVIKCWLDDNVEEPVFCIDMYVNNTKDKFIIMDSEKYRLTIDDIISAALEESEDNESDAEFEEDLIDDDIDAE